MRDFLLLILLSLTTYRTTHLIIKDDFPPVRWARERIIGPDGTKISGGRWAWLGELLSCCWCVSVWVSGALVIALQTATDGVSYPLLVWPAVAAASGLISHWEESGGGTTYNIISGNDS